MLQNIQDAAWNETSHPKSVHIYCHQTIPAIQSNNDIIPTGDPQCTMGSWLECRICDWKVTGSNPCRSIFFSRVNFLCWLLFCYPFHPRVTAGAHKRPQSFCWKCRWQVTAKYACTLPMWLCTKWHGAWFYGVHRTCRDGSSFMWHQPCQCCKYTTLVDIQKRAIKSYSLTKNHM